MHNEQDSGPSVKGWALSLALLTGVALGFGSDRLKPRPSTPDKPDEPLPAQKGAADRNLGKELFDLVNEMIVYGRKRGLGAHEDAQGQAIIKQQFTNGLAEIATTLHGLHEQIKELGAPDDTELRKEHFALLRKIEKMEQALGFKFEGAIPAPQVDPNGIQFPKSKKMID